MTDNNSTAVAENRKEVVPECDYVFPPLEEELEYERGQQQNVGGKHKRAQRGNSYGNRGTTVTSVTKYTKPATELDGEVHFIPCAYALQRRQQGQEAGCKPDVQDVRTR
jgi:hypothetical protein